MNAFLTRLGAVLTDYLSGPIRHGSPIATTAPEKLAMALRPGDVLLVEGNARISVAIKYLTQSTWSHAALYVGDALGAPAPGDEPKVLVEADMRHGVRAGRSARTPACIRAYAGRWACHVTTCTS